MYVGSHEAQLHIHDSWGSATSGVYFGDPSGVNAVQLQLSARQLSGALEIVGDQRGDRVRIDLYDATGPKTPTRTELVILPGPRMKVALPAHLLARPGCPAPPTARGEASVRPP